MTDILNNFFLKLFLCNSFMEPRLASNSLYSQGWPGTYGPSSSTSQAPEIMNEPHPQLVYVVLEIKLSVRDQTLSRHSIKLSYKFSPVNNFWYHNFKSHTETNSDFINNITYEDPYKYPGTLKRLYCYVPSSFHLLPYKVQWQRKQTRYLSPPKSVETCEEYNVSMKVTL